MRQAVEKEMEQYRAMLQEAVLSDRGELGVVSRYMLKSTGKQMRPLLTLLTSALHGQINQKSYAAAMLFEIIHWATLVHDDVIDEAYMRRGEMTLGTLLRSRKAVLIGDYLFARGLKAAVEAGNFDAVAAATKTIEEAVEGELLQSDNAHKLTTDRQAYFEIIKLKTAGLIASAAEAGAMSVGATAEQAADMYRFGEAIGLAFQIQDDILDIDGVVSLGKLRYNDFRERKITLPLIYAIEQSGSKEAVKHIRKAASDEKSIQWLLKFINDNGGIEYSRRVMEELHSQAVEILNKYPESQVRTSLRKFCDYVIGRDK